MTTLAPHLTAFLRDRLAIEQGSSPRTCDSYAYAFKLLLEYASSQLRVRPSKLQVEQLDSRFVLSFLEHLRIQRKNGPSSRNARLSAVKTFMRFLEYRLPSLLEQIRRVLAIPPCKTARPVVQHLAQGEYEALLEAPCSTTRFGVRDRAMLHIAITGGLRASELVNLRLEDVRFDGSYLELRIHGKGRKERVLLLWKEVARSVREWLAIRPETVVPEVFVSAHGQALTRAGFEYIVKKHAKSAQQKAPVLAKRRISPHVLRHTCAVNMLRATGDTRKVALWLGHANSATTDAFYLPVDPTEKLEALLAMQPPSLRPARFKPADQLIELLRPHRKDRTK